MTVMAKAKCWACHAAKEAPGFYRLHVAAALPHDALLRRLDTCRNDTYVTGRSAKLVKRGNDVLLYYRPSPQSWRKETRASVGGWQHIATLYEKEVVVLVWRLKAEFPRYGARLRVNDVLVHRTAPGTHFESRRRILQVAFTTPDTLVAEALAGGDKNWRDRYYARRYAIVSDPVTFYADGRDPTGIVRWPKGVRLANASESVDMNTKHESDGDDAARVVVALSGDCPLCSRPANCSCDGCTYYDGPNIVWWRCRVCRRMTYGCGPDEGHFKAPKTDNGAYCGTMDGKEWDERYSSQAVGYLQ